MISMEGKVVCDWVVVQQGVGWCGVEQPRFDDVEGFAANRLQESVQATQVGSEESDGVGDFGLAYDECVKAVGGGRVECFYS